MAIVDSGVNLPLSGFLVRMVMLLVLLFTTNASFCTAGKVERQVAMLLTAAAIRPLP